MRIALLALLLVACKNEAITFAHAVYGDDMHCDSVLTDLDDSGRDTAVCRGLGMIISCSAKYGSSYECVKVMDMPLERQTQMHPCPERP